MQKLVNDVGPGQAPGVEDRRLATLVVGDHADQAVAYPAELVADREGRDPLQLDPVGAQAESLLPVGEQGVRTTIRNDNDSQSSLSRGRKSWRRCNRVVAAARIRLWVRRWTPGDLRAGRFVPTVSKPGEVHARQR